MSGSTACLTCSIQAIKLLLPGLLICSLGVGELFEHVLIYHFSAFFLLPFPCRVAQKQKFILKKTDLSSCFPCLGDKYPLRWRGYWRMIPCMTEIQDAVVVTLFSGGGDTEVSSPAPFAPQVLAESICHGFCSCICIPTVGQHNYRAAVMGAVSCTLCTSKLQQYE